MGEHSTTDNECEAVKIILFFPFLSPFLVKAAETYSFFSRIQERIRNGYNDSKLGNRKV